MSIDTIQQHPSATTPATPAGPIAGIVSRKLTAERMTAELDRLAALPTVVMDVLRLVDDPNATVTGLESTISHDPVMAARVFKLANSSFYARGKVITTIKEAVIRLGFRTIKSLVMAAWAGKILSTPMRSYAYNRLGLWQHSLGIGMVARDLVRHLGLAADLQDELFLSGLIHDIGKLVLDRFLPAANIVTGYLTPEMETTALGLDHTEIGLQVAKKWHLPDHTCAVIQHHHGLMPLSEFGQHIAIIHLADNLLNHAKLGIPEHIEVTAGIAPEVLDFLQIDEHTVAELERMIASDLTNILAMCEEVCQC